MIPYLLAIAGGYLIGRSRKDEQFANGGIINGYKIFNYTDNIYATDEIFKTKKEANQFIDSFRKRYKKQGYYRTNKMDKISIEHIDLEIIPKDFNPFRFAKGGVPKTKKEQVIQELENLGFSRKVAIELIAKNIDIYEINIDETPKYIAIELEEAYNQED